MTWMRAVDITDEHIGSVITGIESIQGWAPHLLLQSVQRREEGVELLFRWNDDPSPANSRRGLFAIGVTIDGSSLVRVGEPA